MNSFLGLLPWGALYARHILRPPFRAVAAATAQNIGHSPYDSQSEVVGTPG